MRTMPTELIALSALATGDSHAAILNQASHGQAMVCGSGAKVELPRKVTSADRALLERMGVVFGAPVEGDDLFQHATLPEGWTLRPTDHSMHSNLCDAGGAKRANLFYKAAFYDRRADLYVVSRYKIDTQYPCPPIGEPRTATLTDAETGEVLFVGSEVVPDPAYDYNPAALCEAWLDENRPGHKIDKGWTLPAVAEVAHV